MPEECGLNLSWLLKDNYGLPRLKGVRGLSRQRIEPDFRHRYTRSGEFENVCPEVLCTVWVGRQRYWRKGCQLGTIVLSPSHKSLKWGILQWILSQDCKESSVGIKDCPCLGREGRKKERKKEKKQKCGCWESWGIIVWEMILGARWWIYVEHVKIQTILIRFGSFW